MTEDVLHRRPTIQSLPSAPESSGSHGAGRARGVWWHSPSAASVPGREQSWALLTALLTPLQAPPPGPQTALQCMLGWGVPCPRPQAPRLPCSACWDEMSPAPVPKPPDSPAVHAGISVPRPRPQALSQPCSACWDGVSPARNSKPPDSPAMHAGMRCPWSYLGTGPQKDHSRGLQETTRDCKTTGYEGEGIHHHLSFQRTPRSSRFASLGCFHPLEGSSRPQD